MSIPNLFRCPISLELFADPVTLSTGQTYDRPSIEKWLADGNLTCPITMQRLYDTSLVPNLTLRRLISEWLLAGNPSGPPQPTEPPAEFSLSALKKSLQSGEAGDEIKVETLRKLRIVSEESDTGKACLVQYGFLPIMMQLLLSSSTSATDPDIVDLALDCVLHLSPAAAHLNPPNVLLMEESNLAQLALLLERGCVEVQIKLCSLIETVASETQELCTIFGRSRRLLHVLVSLLCQCSDTSIAAVGAVSSVCALEANRENVIRDGGIDGLVAYLSDSIRGDAVPALATLEVLLQLEMGRKALLKKANGVRVLVRNVFRVSSSHEGSDHAVGSLMAVCGSSGRARMEAVSCGVVTQLLMLIQSRCGPEVKAKARALLKMFKFVG